MLFGSVNLVLLKITENSYILSLKCCLSYKTNKIMILFMQSMRKYLGDHVTFIRPSNMEIWKTTIHLNLRGLTCRTMPARSKCGGRRRFHRLQLISRRLLRLRISYILIDFRVFRKHLIMHQDSPINARLTIKFLRHKALMEIDLITICEPLLLIEVPLEK